MFSESLFLFYDLLLMLNSCKSFQHLYDYSLLCHLRCRILHQILPDVDQSGSTFAYFSGAVAGLAAATAM